MITGTGGKTPGTGGRIPGTGGRIPGTGGRIKALDVGYKEKREDTRDWR